MATQTLDLTALLSPDPTLAAPCYWAPAHLFDTNDKHKGVYVLCFPDGSVKTIASCDFRVPEDYVSAPKFIIVWKTTLTSGAVVWDVDYNCVAVAETLDPSAFDRSLTVTDTASGTTNHRNDAEVNGTAGDFTVGDKVLVSVSRDLADGADTLGGIAQLAGFFFQYSDT